jgi:hypothetical protein
MAMHFIRNSLIIYWIFIVQWIWKRFISINLFYNPIRKSISTISMWKDILMKFNYCIDSSLSWLIYNFYHLFEISFVIIVFVRLYSCPHNSQSNSVKSILCQVIDVLLSIWQYGIVFISFWNVRWNSYNNICSMKIYLSILFI